MFTPDGFAAHEMDPTMLLNIWACHLAASHDQPMIFAGIGSPSFPLNEDFALSAVYYWQEFLSNSQRVSDYDLPSGGDRERAIMAKALSRWYDQLIEPEDVFFTVGGSAALRMLFQVLKELRPEGKIMTTSPYYPFYVNPLHQNRFHFIDLLQVPRYKLTAELLQENIDFLGVENIQAFLFCEPNNPLGWVIGEGEWRKIGEVLKATPKEIPILLDEAYAELTFGSKHVSLLQVAPELKQRLILLRSATKSFSASGERIALILCFDQKWKAALARATVFSYGHAPKCLQYAYAQTMLEFTEEKRKALSSHYQEQVDFVQKRMQKMPIQMKDKGYAVEGTFYLLADLSCLLGGLIPVEAEVALGYGGMIKTDVELCYSLLFQKQMMLGPLSFSGADPHAGLVRITCGKERIALMDRLEQAIQTY